MTVVSVSLPGGDDVNALVVDIGSANFRAGFAGEDVPRIMESSHFKISADQDSDMGINSRRTPEPGNFFTSSPNCYMKSALLTDSKARSIDLDTEVFEHIMNYSFNNRARSFEIDMSDSPVILSEPNKSTSKYRKACFESLFESFNVPAASLLKRATGSAFAVGKQSGLVVDIGASMTSVTPVYDGFVLQKPASEFFGIGGDLLDTILDELLKKRKTNVSPLYQRRDHVTPQYMAASRLATVREIKHELCKMSSASMSGVPGYANWSLAPLSDAGPSSTTLPDGTVIELSPFQLMIPELLFDPTPVQAIPHLSQSAVSCGFSGIGVAALETISNCDVDIRKAVSSDFILTGGSSLFAGMPDRMIKFLQNPDVKSANPLVPIAKPKVTASPLTVDRMASSWLGCSIIASCATFQQLWVSQRQYQEEGLDRVVARQLFW